MLGRTGATSVWVRGQPTDMRLGFRGLAALVEQELRRDVCQGDLFLFVNRRRTSAKVLLWDGSGLCIYAKRLSSGCFARLWTDAARGGPLRLSTTELNLFLERASHVREPKKLRRKVA